jgi:hypothetical protein
MQVALRFLSSCGPAGKAKAKAEPKRSTSGGKKKEGNAGQPPPAAEQLAAAGADPEEDVEDAGSQSSESSGEEGGQDEAETASQPLKSALLKPPGAKQKPGKVGWNTISLTDTSRHG